MRAVEAFSGVQILTWAILSNHFHILVYVPEQAEVSDQDLGRRMRTSAPHDESTLRGQATNSLHSLFLAPFGPDPGSRGVGFEILVNSNFCIMIE